MSWGYTSADVVRAARQARATVEEDLGRVDSFHHWHQKQRAEVDAELAQASRDLGQALLPSFHPKAIERAVGLTGYSPLAHENLAARVTAEETQLAGQIAAIEADRRYWDAERDKSLRGLTPALHCARLAQQQRGFDDFVRSAEHPRLQRLCDLEFGTPKYDVGWWRISHHQDKSCAEEILRRFPAFGGDFARFAAELARCRAASAQLARDLAAAQAVERLLGEHERLVEARRTTKDRWLAWARERLVSHVLGTDPSAMSKWLEREPPTRLIFLRASGLRAKVSYLDGLFQANVGKMSMELRERHAKLTKIEAAYARRPRTMPADQFAKAFVDKRPKYHARFQKYAKGYHRVQSFDRFHAGRGVEQLLWWDVMTDGRLDGSFLPDVSRFRETHPDYSYHRPDRSFFKEPKEDELAVPDYDEPPPSDEAVAAATDAGSDHESVQGDAS